MRRHSCRNAMPVNLQWQEIALRLVLTVVAGAVFGINRSEHGRPAGLRTTLLVCLAASIAMIQTNLLLATSAQLPQDRYSTLTLTLGLDRPTDEEVYETIRAAGLRVVVQGVYYDATTERRELRCEVRWRAQTADTRFPSVVQELSRLPGVASLRWTPQGTPAGAG
jgi:uncharacterized membrane protein YhiD involved in acid resistance